MEHPHVKDNFSLYMINFFKAFSDYPGMKELIEYHKWKGIKCPDDNLSYKIFRNSLNFIKILGVSFFIILALINIIKNDNYFLITEEPKQFLYESLLFAASVIIPLFIMLYLRNGSLKEDPYSYISLFSVIFILFIVLNYILEASGFWAWSFNYKSEKSNIFADILSGENKILKYIAIGIVLIILYGIVIMITAGNSINMSSIDVYDHIIMNPTVTFIIECVLFSLISAVPVFYIAHNRNTIDNTTAVTFLLSTVQYMIIFYICQYAGMWEVLFQGNNLKKFIL